MGLEAVYKRPGTSQPHPAHPVFPYLLKGMEITRPNQVWCSDITFIPVSRGYLYLVAIMDWATRKVLSWRISNTMHADFCVDALKEAIEKYGPPEITNTDQGSQFTGSDWITTLTDARVRVSMDGRGRYLDNMLASPAFGLSNGSGGPSNTKRYICRTLLTASLLSASSMTGSTSTTRSGLTPPLAKRHRTRHMERQTNSRKRPDQ
jgi:transposase InsO family protein